MNQIINELILLSIFNKIKAYTFYITIAFTLFFISCSDDNEGFTVGNDFVDSDIIKVDTFKVDLSTICLDSFPTSGNSVIWVGKYHDSILGEISSNSVFEIGIPESRDFEENDVYDSIALVIRYNGNSIGDTMQSFGFSVHEVTNYYQLNDDGYLYNTSLVSYNQSELGSIEFIPCPNNDEDLVIRVPLNNSIGLDFFNGLIDNKDNFSTYELFTQYYNGILLKASENSSALVGFESGYGDVIIRIYSHRTTDDIENIENDFYLSYPEKQFNQISKVLTIDELKNISSQRETIKTSLTNNLSYLYGGAGLLTKVNFPTLEHLLYYTDNLLLRAELVLYPEKAYYDPDFLPDDLYLYETNIANQIGDMLINSYGYPITSSVSVDELYRENTYYKFDITNYINNELSDSYIDPEDGLLVTLPYDELYADFYNIFFSGEATKPKLNLYFLTY